MVIADNATRWNLTYSSLHRALKLRVRIMTFCAENEEELAADILTKREWDELKDIEILLEPFYSLTKRMEGNPIDGHHGSIWEALPAVEMLLQHLEKAKITYRSNRYLMTCINLAWVKLSQIL